MGVKNMFKKSSKLFEKEGFYIILFVCLCIVAVTAVYISRQNKNIANQPEPNKIVNENPTADNPQPSDPDPAINSSSNKTDDPSKITNSSSISTTNPSSNQKTSKTIKKNTNVSVTFKMAMPVDGDVVKKFDKNHLEISKAMHQWETHEGIDIACELTTEVKAVQSGTVEKVLPANAVLHNNKGGFGVTVVIDHGNGYKTYYSNLDENVKVKVNDKVKKGQVIGVVGDTSTRESVSVEGSHLHFTVMKKVNKEYVTVNPMDYLK